MIDETILNENRKLKLQLNGLLKRALTNEQKQALFDSFSIDLISANTPAQLRDSVLFQMQVQFKLHNVVLTLIDLDKDAENLFYGQDELAKSLYDPKLHILHLKRDKEKISSLNKKPLLGLDVISQYQWMVASLTNVDLCKSAALIPLMRNDKLIGSLLLLSGDENRYQKGIGTTFLQKLSAMTAVAIENCLTQQRIKEMGYQDPLTQAYNRRYFDMRLNDEIEKCLDQKTFLACLFIDVDFFKKVNDSFGHHVGDLVLVRLVKLIKLQVRTCDVVSRYGGEEFSVILPALSLTDVRVIAERIRKAVELDVELSCGKTNLHVTVSIGLELLEAKNVTHLNLESISDMLLQHADVALYKAKASGRNQVVVYENTDLFSPLP